MGTEQAAAIVRGRLQLVLGDELGITAREVSTAGDRIRLGAADLRIATKVLIDNGVDHHNFEALVVVSNDGGAAVPPNNTQDDVTVEILGVPDGPLTVLRTLDPNTSVAMLAEASAMAWRQRLSDVADTADQLTSSDAESLGPIAIPGAPMLTELRAERRRLLVKESAGRVPAEVKVSAVLDDVITDLRAAVRFGAAGLVDLPDEQVAKGLASAVADGSWVQRVRLLLAAQEIAAIELVRASRTDRPEGEDADESSRWDRILDRLDTERTATDDLTSILCEVRDRLPAEPTRRAQRLTRRKLLEDTLSVRKSVDAYISVTRSPAPAVDESVNWDDALEALGQLDEASAHGRAIAVPAPVSSRESNDEADDAPNIEEIASLLGEIFARQLPESRMQVTELGRLHPGENADTLIRRVKRQAIADLGQPGTRDDSTPVLETVATLAMSIALLRGMEPKTETEFADVGRRILDRAQGISEMHNRAGQALPLAVAGFERAARQLQPVIVEALFRAMAVAAPSGAGAARDLYKNARSTVWRARHKRGLAAVAAMGAGRALQQALGSGAARLLVREVDRALVAPKHFDLH